MKTEFCPKLTRVDLDKTFQKYSKIKESDANEQIRLLRRFQKIFHGILLNKVMFIDKRVQNSGISDDDRMWFRKRYGEMKRKLLDCFHNSDRKIKELSLHILMRFVALEAKYPYFDIHGPCFPYRFFQSVILEILAEDKAMPELTKRFCKFLEYDDVKFNLLRVLESATKKKQAISQQYLHQNFFSLLENVTLSSEEEDEECDEDEDEESDNDDDDDESNDDPDNDDNEDADANDKDETDEGDEDVNSKAKNLCQRDGSEEFQLVHEKIVKLFSSTWMGFLKFQLGSALYRKVLIILPDKVLPHLDNPLLLTDFLMESFSKGGMASVLALNSLFILIQSYNLEYPEFYKQLYSMITQENIRAKHRARFFYLIDLVLRSTHLPEYLVAAFVKKLSRLALTASPNSVVVIVPFIRNLLVRHPNLSVMIHRYSDNETSKTEGFNDDPFIADESDPAKCRALESSLWEIKSLQSHYVPEVAVSCRMVNRMLPNMETDITDKYDGTLVEMLDREINRAQQAEKEVAVTYQRPSGLFEGSEDKMNSFWSL